MQNNRPVLILSIFCSLVMILDSVLVTLYTLPLDEPLPSLNLALILNLFAIFFL